MKKYLLLTGLIFASIPTILFAREYTSYTDCTQDNGTKFCDGYFAGKEKTATETIKSDDIVKDTSEIKTDTENSKTATNTEKEKKRDNYFFVGADIGFAATSYRTEQASDYMPSAFLKMGLNFGFKFDVIEEYGLGITGTMDFLLPSEMNPDYVEAMGADSITVGYDLYGFYLDNYFKTGPKETMVIGFGGADISSTVTVKAGGETYTEESDETSSAMMLKMGIIYKMSDMMDWTIMGKFAFPEEKSGLNTIAMIDLGLRLRF
ncbi:MAG: hypothetical protein JW974_03040 [Alphaproteobacteria bacterium]|nr:hypothetical protein [Alphaproteobacteria bacterium]MBN2674927.1 hypothetical protein [Alphaproteobacteria bacterium]